jgi:starvation-inducible outer membrane lipoprotein
MPAMNRLVRVLASAAALALAGCSSVPLTSIP